MRNFFLLVALCLPFAFSASVGAQQSAPAMDISGSWAGVLGTGQNQLHLLVTFAKLSNGDYSGQVNSVDQGAVLPFSSVTIQGQKIHFEIAQIGGVYEGTLSDDQKQISGTWTQANTPAQSLNLMRSAAPESTSTGSSAVAPGPKEKPISLPLDVTVPIVPTAFKADGEMHLVYELHIVNMSPWNCSLTRVEVLADNSSNSLASFSGAALDGMLERPGISALPKSKLSPGTEAIVFMWVTVDSKADVPASIRHRINVMLGDYPDELSVETNPLPVHTGPIVISPPLRGDHWLAAHGPSDTSGHRRALIPINGHAVISQRFAIDWVKLGDDGQTYTLETIGGNHVIINIGNGCYAFYAHLQPGSIRVEVGDHVHRGQVLGLVGNTGNSTEPHLHFHISNASSPLGSEGLPYLFSSFEVEGKGFGWKPTDAEGTPEKHTMEMPTENEVVRFTSQP